MTDNLSSSNFSSLLEEPGAYQPAADQALKEMVAQLDPAFDSAIIYYVGFRGSFGDHHATPRTLKAEKLGKMVCLEGIVTRCKLFRHLKAVFDELIIRVDCRCSRSTKDAKFSTFLCYNETIPSKNLHRSIILRCRYRSTSQFNSLSFS